MTLQGEYEPSAWDWVRDQVDTYERSGGREGTTLWDTGKPVVVVTMRGRRTGRLRKAPVMRVEHGGEYAIVASKGGDPENPGWYFNLLSHPEVEIQDATEIFGATVREVQGGERDEWWGRAVEAWPAYEEYQANTDRRIPVLVATPKP
jgi:F420H(2)-dependent quinone reductase